MKQYRHFQAGNLWMKAKKGLGKLAKFAENS